MGQQPRPQPQHDPSAIPVPVPVAVGIDVAKATLDCYLDAGPADAGRHLQFANDDAGIAALVARLRPPLKVHLVVLEATGRLHRHVAAELLAAGIPVALVNPQRAREYARATGRLEKTDRVDAAALAGFARAAGHVLLRQRSARLVELDDLIARRRALVQVRIAERNRLAEPGQPELARTQAKRLLRVVDQQVQDLDRAIAALIDGDDGLRRKAEVIASVPGVSDGTAHQLLADLPELGELSRQRIAKLAGLAPLANDSGPRRGPRSIRGGRGHVRCALYMAAFNATRYCERFRQFAQRLRAAGKPYKVVLTAAMRKLLITLNQMVKTDTVYDPKLNAPAT
jgi:transposase